MDLKAFNKLHTEAVEALAERRLKDAISLTEAILKDTIARGALSEDIINAMNADYEELLHSYSSTKWNARVERKMNEVFRQVIESLQMARGVWQTEHKATSYGRMASQMVEFGAAELADQLHRTTRSHVGEKVYHEALDAAFGLAWCVQFNTSDSKVIVNRLRKSDNFVRRVLVGALLMSELDYFSSEKLLILRELGTMALTDLNNASLMDDDAQQAVLADDAHDLLARVAVALTLLYIQYMPFLPYFPELNEALTTFFHEEVVRTELPLLLRAFVCQSLTDRVGKRVDDILPIIKEAFEKQQPHLGSNTDEEEAKGEGESLPDELQSSLQQKDSKIEVHVAKIDLTSGQKLFRKMASYAESVDRMRQSDMDVNCINFSHMKNFPFFNHFAHWFYPFNLNEPTIQRGLHHPDGQLDVMTLSIMDHSRFCDSDRYSYASMMAYLRRDGRHAISDDVRNQIEEMRDADDDELPFDLNKSAEWRLNPYTSYCQTCYRFLHSHVMGDEYSSTFAPSDAIILPLLPLFAPLYTEFSDVEDSVAGYLLMGDNEHAIVLLNHCMEHYGTTAYALELRGRAFMQLQLWRNAVSDFQQSLLINEDSETSLCMARCYEAMHEWERALPLLIQEDQRLEGKDADIIEEIARCYLQLQQWDEAVQRFFQLELMGEHLNVSRRGIGWCSLHQGKFERAQQYYQTQINSTRRPSWEDLINLGHALWLQGRTAEALTAYHQFAATFNRTKKGQRHEFRHWSEAFREDARALLANHFSEAELALMQDAIAMK